MSGFRQLILVSIFFVLCGCASYPNIDNREPVFAFEDTQNTTLGKLYAQGVKHHDGKSGFFPIGEGEDAFAVRAILAEKAERSIDAQYYLLHDDYMGNLFIGILLKAADRGVRVRLLLDGAGFGGFSDSKLASFDAHPNFEIRYFNPFKSGPKYLQFFTRMNVSTRRMHNKAFIVDNQVAVVGGRNIGNEYFAAHQTVEYGDLDSVSIGPVVKKVTGFFDQYWNSPVVFNITDLITGASKVEVIKQDLDQARAFLQAQDNADYINRLKESEFSKDVHYNRLNLFWGNYAVMADAPEKVIHSANRTDLHMTDDISFQFKKAKNEIIIFNPYFIPGKSGTKGLSELVKQGINVRVITNSLASIDQTAVYAHYSKYRKKLLQAGVEIYEVLPVKPLNKKSQDSIKQPDLSKIKSKKTKNTLHAKSFIIDRRYVFIGSMNFDARSAFENTEIGIVFDSKDMAQSIANWFDLNADTQAYKLSLNKSGKTVWIQNKDGKVTTFNHEPETTAWRRFIKWVMKIIPMESML
jgi:putative cardiolipin synthase